jgi:hypothetical protein
MHRFVFDTDVIVAAMRSPSGASAAFVRRGLGPTVNDAGQRTAFFEYEKNRVKA